MLARNARDLTANIARTSGGARVDLVLVAEMVTHGAKVLDVGCGDGAASNCRARASTRASARAWR